MINSVGKSSAPNMAGSGAMAENATIAGAALDSNGAFQKDAKESSTGAKFGEVWKQIQTKYGAKPEKPREIKKTLGKDDFLRIMITQMKNQDPTTPFKAEQFATELAQYTSVEQLQNINQALGKVTTQNQPLERMAMTNLIGKTVTVDRERFPHTEGTNESLSFVLARDAKEVKVVITNEAGETVSEQDLGPQKKGENSFSWDGTKKNTLPSKTGNYIFKVAAKDAQGGNIQIDSKMRSKVLGVGFEGNEAVLLIGNLMHPDKISMRNIVQIESDGINPNQIPGAQSLAKASGMMPQAGSGAGVAQPELNEIHESGQRPEQHEEPMEHSSPVSPAVTPGYPQSGAPEAQKAGNFFNFQKGKGSSNVGEEGLSPEVAQALAKYQQQAQQAQSQAMLAQPQAGSAGPKVPEEKGFPNGLGDYNQVETPSQIQNDVKLNVPRAPTNAQVPNRQQQERR